MILGYTAIRSDVSDLIYRKIYIFVVEDLEHEAPDLDLLYAALLV